MAGPQTAGTNLCLQRRDHPLADGIAAVVRMLDHEVERLELLADEIVHPIKLRLVLRIRLEFVTHRAVLPNVVPVATGPHARSAPENTPNVPVVVLSSPVRAIPQRDQGTTKFRVSERLSENATVMT